MCNGLRPSKRKSAIIFKVVARKKKGTRYYSIAMGFAYPKKGRIPKIKVQHRIGYHFDADILSPKSFGYARRMFGRTAGFISKQSAKDFVPRIGSIEGYVVLVVKAKVTDGLMSGRYSDSDIIAGRHIEWLE